MDDRLSSAERAFRALQANTESYQKWAADVRQEWAARHAPRAPSPQPEQEPR